LKPLLFTVFTPVYNRCETIHRVWDSLCAQTYQNFEWIVVDDGSTDGVSELIKQYKRRATFPMIVIRQTNQGKHIAWNKAVDIAKGELFVPADSDDAFVSNTLERFATLWNSIPIDTRLQFSGINCLCSDPATGKIIGNLFPQENMITNNLDLTFCYHIAGEKWGTIRTDLLRQRRFPEIPGTCYPMTYLWFGLARNYKVLCVNEVLRHYFHDQHNHISAGKSGIGRSAAQRRHYACWHLNTNWDYIKLAPLGRIRALAATARASMEIPGGIHQSLNEIRGSFKKLIFLAILPTAYFYWYRRR